MASVLERMTALQKEGSIHFKHESTPNPRLSSYAVFLTCSDRLHNNKIFLSNKNPKYQEYQEEKHKILHQRLMNKVKRQNVRESRILNS